MHFRGLKTIITELKNIIWGIPTLSLLIVFGIYFTLKSSFYRPKAIKSIVRDTLFSLKKKDSNGISPFSAVMTALGGTVGVGSIVGVGYGLAVGGAGSIFWMWVCSFFGMGLKYAEVKIALTDRERQDGIFLGGAPFRLKKLGYKKSSVVFCLLCALASFGTGNLTQIGSMASFFDSVGISETVGCAVCVLIIALAVFGGRGRIADINSFIVPSASALYLIACLALLVLNHEGILPAFKSIFKEAFGFSAITGGFSGAMLSHVIREGFVRSLFSNEAGMGSSPLAHATAEISNPCIQAKWGIFEIFFDTFVVSTLTAICLLSSGFSNPSDMFSFSFGNIGSWIFGGLIAVFAFASVISWCYYSECCLSFLFPKNKTALTVYRILFSLCALFGFFLSESAVWEISDILNACMMFPNLFLLFKCRKEIERMV